MSQAWYYKLGQNLISSNVTCIITDTIALYLPKMQFFVPFQWECSLILYSSVCEICKYNFGSNGKYNASNKQNSYLDYWRWILQMMGWRQHRQFQGVSNSTGPLLFSWMKWSSVWCISSIIWIFVKSLFLQFKISCNWPTILCLSPYSGWAISRPQWMNFFLILICLWLTSPNMNAGICMWELESALAKFPNAPIEHFFHHLFILKKQLERVEIEKAGYASSSLCCYDQVSWWLVGTEISDNAWTFNFFGVL